MNDKEFIKKLLDACDTINNYSRQPQANYIVTSSFFAETLEKYEKYEKRKRIIDKLLKRGS